MPLLWQMRTSRSWELQAPTLVPALGQVTPWGTRATHTFRVKQVYRLVFCCLLLPQPPDPERIMPGSLGREGPSFKPRREKLVHSSVLQGPLTSRVTDARGVGCCVWAWSLPWQHQGLPGPGPGDTLRQESPLSPCSPAGGPGAGRHREPLQEHHTRVTGPWNHRPWAEGHLRLPCVSKGCLQQGRRRWPASQEHTWSTDQDATTVWWGAQTALWV